MFLFLTWGSVNAEVIRFGDILGEDSWNLLSDISPDGTVVIGEKRPAGESITFFWTVDGGISILENPDFNLNLDSVSSGGSVIVGFRYPAMGNYEAFRWTKTEGVVGMGYLPSPNDFMMSNATGVSSDGSVIVGSSSNEFYGFQAFRWTEIEGLVGLGYLNENSYYSTANGVSTDGVVIIGSSVIEWFPDSLPVAREEAFRWTESEGMVGLGYLLGTELNSRALGASEDGSVIVGVCQITPDTDVFPIELEHYEAFRWTQETGMVGLGHLQGGRGSAAYDVSSDGSVVFGEALNQQGKNEAFRWTKESGMQSIEEWLTENGVDTKGLQLLGAHAISDNGIIIGEAINLDGNTEGYLASVDKITYLIDSDGDGLLDGEEDVNQNGIIDTGETNPFDPDSDDDGINDFREVSCGSNPLDAKSLCPYFLPALMLLLGG